MKTYNSYWSSETCMCAGTTLLLQTLLEKLSDLTTPREDNQKEI